MEKSDISAESEKPNLPPLNTEHLQDILDTCFVSDANTIVYILKIVYIHKIQEA